MGSIYSLRLRPVRPHKPVRRFVPPEPIPEPEPIVEVVEDEPVEKPGRKAKAEDSDDG